MSKDVKFVYETSRWDGPLSGVCKYKENKYWFKCAHDYHQAQEDVDLKFTDIRIYGIYELTEEEWSSETSWHLLFKEYVGTHCDYNENGKRTGKIHKDTKKFSKFFKAVKNKEKLNLSDRKPIGYFDMSELKFRKEKFRKYFIEGESPIKIHTINCQMAEIIEWRYNADDWINGDFKGTTSGFAICIEPDDDGKKCKAKWTIIDFCPWCGVQINDRK